LVVALRDKTHFVKEGTTLERNPKTRFEMKIKEIREK